MSKPNLHNAAAALGSKGGKAGRGASKRRSPEFYRELARKGVEARRKKREAWKRLGDAWADGDGAVGRNSDQG